MNTKDIGTLYDAARLLMISGAAGTSALDEAALGLSGQLMNWLAQRLRADADQQKVRSGARKAATPEAPLPLRKSA